NTLEGTHKVDPARQPKAIDTTDTAGPFAGQTLLGIYEIESDAFKVCFARPGQERPEQFTTKSGTGHLLHVRKRHESAEADLEKLQGTWTLVSAMRDGKPLPEAEVKRTTIVFRGDRFRFPREAEYATSQRGTFKI